MMKTRTLCALLVGLLTGCSIHVEKTDPKPNVALSGRDEHSLRLALKDDIQSSFEIPAQNGVMGGDVEGWRDTLVAGYHNGLETYFQVPTADGRSDWTLEISRAELSFAPTSIATRNGTPMAVTSVEVQIVYRAQLMDKTGRVLKVSAATAPSKTSVTDKQRINDGVRSAVETMYELIAHDLFGTPTNT